MKTIAIDPGFGNIKTVWLDETGQIQARIIPSVIGIGQLTDMGMIGLGRQRRGSHPLSLAFDGVSYLVGDDVHRHAEPIEDLDHGRLYQGLAAQTLLYAGLGSSANGRSEETVNIMLGYPVEVMRDKERARAALRTARSWMVGHHSFTLDGRALDYQVDQVRAIAQPLGAYFDWGLDNAGDWVRETEATRRPVAVLDIGFNTLDLFAVENGEIVARFTDGDNLGLHRVARAVQRHLQDRHGVRWSLHQADDLIKTYLSRRRPIASCADGDIDMSGLIAQALEETFTAVNGYITARWGTARQFYRLIVTGGGAEALREPILRHYPFAYLPPEPVLSNARGLLKWANRLMKNS